MARLQAVYPVIRGVYFKVGNERKCSPAFGRQMKLQGLTAGIPDAFCAYPAGSWHGLFIEFKSSGKKPSPVQTDAMFRFSEQGFKCIWADNLDDIWRMFEEYIRGSSV